jgi:hypothetical protein
VLKKRIEYAKLHGGWRDRYALDKMLGMAEANFLSVSTASITTDYSAEQRAMH